jgi:hypothetical protein
MPKGRPRRASLCAECGEAMADRGYCGVCDRYWTLGIGQPCPKHDLPLGEVPPGPLLADGEFTDWASVAQYADPIAAGAPRFAWRPRDPHVPGLRAHGGARPLRDGRGRRPLQVPEHLAHEARIILAQTWAPPPNWTTTTSTTPGTSWPPSPGAVAG